MKRPPTTTSITHHLPTITFTTHHPIHDCYTRTLEQETGWMENRQVSSSSSLWLGSGVVRGLDSFWTVFGQDRQAGGGLALGSGRMTEGQRHTTFPAFSPPPTLPFLPSVSVPSPTILTPPHSPPLLPHLTTCMHCMHYCTRHMHCFFCCLPLPLVPCTSLSCCMEQVDWVCSGAGRPDFFFTCSG